MAHDQLTQLSTSTGDQSRPAINRAILCSHSRTCPLKIKLTKPGSIANPSPFDNDPTIIFRDGKYIFRRLESGSHKHKSLIWRYGEDTERFDTSDEGAKWERRWLCNVCKEPNRVSYQAGSTTVHAAQHLKAAHSIIVSDKKSDSSPGLVKPSIYMPDQLELQEAIVELVAVDHLPFTIIESPRFRRFATVLNPDAESYLPDSGDTVKNWAGNLFKRKRKELADQILQSSARINISFDGWTSGNGYALLGIVATWLDKATSIIKNALIGLKEISGHTGECMADCIEDVFGEYGLEDDLIGSYGGDNASNNDSALRILSEEHQEKRVRCIGHVFNLAVRSLIHESEKSCAPIQEDDHDNDIQKDEHREIPALHKLRKLAKYLNRSTTLKAKWRNEMKTMVPLDNDTRWNSVFRMVKSVVDRKAEVDNFIRAATKALSDKKKSKKMQQIALNSDDWRTLDELKMILEPFEDFTNRLQGTTWA
jgi:hypothetical protein